MIYSIENNTLSLTFAPPWTIEDHAAFIRSKSLPEAEFIYNETADEYTVRASARFAHLVGLADVRMAMRTMPIAEHLFDYQKWIVQMALDAKRFAIWSDCGTGKTPMQLEWARQVQHRTGPYYTRVLILAPLAVIPQTIEEAAKFYPDGDVAPARLDSREELFAFCTGQTRHTLAITNPEKFIAGVIPELRHLSGLVVDESSFLKSGGGKIKWNLIKSARGIEYKLSCTATPAPNDTMEYASQAAFLEKLRNEGEILWTYFARDPKTQAWKVKAHAREAFYRFMSSWSIYLRKPGAYGFADPFKDVPEPLLIEHRVEPTEPQIEARDRALGVREMGELLPREKLGVTQRSKLSQVAKGFVYKKGESGAERLYSRKPDLVAALAEVAARAGKQVLIWCIFDEEARIIGGDIAGVDGVSQLHGHTPEAERGRILEDFRHGKIRVLIGKARMLGYGLNFPFVETMIFSGFDDSFEAFYQAVRRAYRYGAKHQLTVHLPYIPGLEDHIWENILRKKSQWEADTEACEAAYAEALKGGAK